MSVTLADRTVGELSAMTDSADAALRMILRDAGASRGFLYVSRDDSMRLAAAHAPGDEAELWLATAAA